MIEITLKAVISLQHFLAFSGHTAFHKANPDKITDINQNEAELHRAKLKESSENECFDARC